VRSGSGHTSTARRFRACPSVRARNFCSRFLAQGIRKSIAADKSLSTYVHNVKVIVQDGTVTLKGPVRSEEEKASVEAKAKEAAGNAPIQNEITVAK